MPGRRRRAARTARLIGVAAVALATATLLITGQPSAQALTTWDVQTPVTGNATWFYGLGDPYGGCGLPQKNLDSQYFVALNVYDLPNDYSTFYNRPMDASLASKMGMWNNGHNCGRWVQVSIADYCSGDNDGAMNKPFCRNGDGWVSDKYNGATLNMVVGDSCGDGNAWCRDDPYHLDLAEGSLNHFAKDGQEVGDMNPAHWNNRHISWKFIPAPDYTGDIKVGFLQSAMRYWAAISVSHLANGIHAVEYYQDGTWKSAKMNGDMGQAYIISGTTEGGSDFQIRVRDVNDELINDGRVYRFGFPSSCAGNCNGAYTPVDYTTSTGPVTTPPSGAGGVTGTCTAAYKNTGSWPGGFKADVTVTAGATPIENWTVSWPIPDGQTYREAWNGALTVTDSTATIKSTGYNGSLAPGASATVGLTGDGTAAVPTAMTCTPS
jgi:hypothetical protein